MPLPLAYERSGIVGSGSGAIELSKLKLASLSLLKGIDDPGAFRLLIFFVSSANIGMSIQMTLKIE